MTAKPKEEGSQEKAVKMVDRPHSGMTTQRKYPPGNSKRPRGGEYKTGSGKTRGKQLTKDTLPTGGTKGQKVQPDFPSVPP